MESFSRNLKQITFKTFYRNQMTTFDYDDLFADRRVIVFSITNAYTSCSGQHMEQFEKSYEQLCDLGINNVYVIDSVDWLVGPWADKRSTDIRGLPDRDMQFVSALAQHYNMPHSTDILARLWQYVVIIDNGKIEHIWQAAFKESAPLVVVKDQRIRYRGLTVDTIKKYLVDNTK